MASMTSSAMSLTLDEISSHNLVGESFWVVVDGYVLDITQFLPEHPGMLKKIMMARERLGPDISPNFLDHFPHTVAAFREACRNFDKRGQPVSLQFKESKSPVLIIARVTD